MVTTGLALGLLAGLVLADLLLPGVREFTFQGEIFRGLTFGHGGVITEASSNTDHRLEVCVGVANFTATTRSSSRSLFRSSSSNSHLVGPKCPENKNITKNLKYQKN